MSSILQITALAEFEWLWLAELDGVAMALRSVSLLGKLESKLPVKAGW